MYNMYKWGHLLPSLNSPAWPVKRTVNVTTFVGFAGRWLGREDSNPHRQIQSLLSYH
jgi:hypothetical protein